MFDLTEESLRGLIEESRADLGKALANYEESIKDYAGPGHRPGEWSEDDRGNPENRAAEFVQITAGQFAGGDAKVRVSTTLTDEAVRMEAKAHEFAVNRYVRQTRMRDLNEETAVDFSLFSAMTIVEPGDSKKKDERGLRKDAWPKNTRISPTRRVWDTQAINRQERLFEGHLEYVDPEEVIAAAKKDPDTGWDIQRVMAAASADSGNDELEKRRDTRRQVDRKQLAYWSIWVPGVDLSADEAQDLGLEIPDGADPDEYRGAWFYLPMTGGGEGSGEAQSGWLRKPRPYWGHRGGPYSSTGGYIVPDDPAWLSPTMSFQSQSDALNAHMRSMLDSMDDYARMLLVEASDKDLLEKIKRGGHHQVIPVNTTDLARKVASMEKGGVSQQHLLMTELLGNLCDRFSGVSDLTRGIATGDATATENIFAQQAHGSRQGFLVLKFRQFVQDQLERISWYFHKQSSVYIRLPQEAIAELGQKGAGGIVYHGGADIPWEEMDLRIDPGSLAQSGDALHAQRFQAVTSLVSQFAPMMAAVPWARWRDFWGMAGDLLEMPMLPEMFEYDLAREVGGLMLQTGLQPQAPSQGSPQPRLGPKTSINVAAGGIASGGFPRASKGPSVSSTSGAASNGKAPTSPTMAGNST